MATPSLKKIAYHTLQQGKTLAGIAHKELSTKLMEVFAPEASPGNFPGAASGAKTSINFVLNSLCANPARVFPC